MSACPKTAPPLVRFQKIAALLATGRHVQAPEFAGELEVSTKTIYRDLEFMRSQLQLPIECDTMVQGRNCITGGFYFRTPVQLCPCCLGKIQ